MNRSAVTSSAVPSAPMPLSDGPLAGVGDRRPTWVFVDLSWPDFGGHEVMLLRWIHELQAQRSVEPVLVCAKGTRLVELAARTMRVIEVDRSPRRHRLLQMFDLLRHLLVLKWTRRPTWTVVAEGCLMAQRHGLFVAQWLRMRTLLYVPLVSSFSSMGSPNGAALDQQVREDYAQRPDAWLTITPEQADELRAWSGAPQPMYSLANTVPEDFRPAPHAPLPPAPQPLRVLVLGRLDPFQKGLDQLLAYLQTHPDLGRRIRVSIVGEGEYGPTLHAAVAEDPALANWLVLEPWQPAEAVLARHDVLLIPSRFEGVPLVMLEAMACGMPVIATDMPGTHPFVPDACRFRFGDFDRAFATALQLQDDADLRTRVLYQIRESFEASSSPTAFALAVRQLTAALTAVQ